MFSLLPSFTSPAFLYQREMASTSHKRAPTGDNDHTQKRPRLSSWPHGDSPSLLHPSQYASSSSSGHDRRIMGVPIYQASSSTTEVSLAAFPRESMTHTVHIFQASIQRLTPIGLDALHPEGATPEEQKWGAQLRQLVQSMSSWDIVTSLVRWSSVREQLETLCGSHPDPQRRLYLRKPDIRETIEAVWKVQEDSGLLRALMQLPDADILRIMDLLDEILMERNRSEDHDSSILYFCRMLCGKRGLLPKSVTVWHDQITAEERIASSGGFADVFKGRLNEEVVAIKALRSTRTASLHDRQSFCKEVSVWRHITHPNIVAFRGVYSNPRYTMCIVSKWMVNGTIMEYLKQNNPPPNRRLEMVVAVATGLRYLHGRGIIHGDLKGANILVDEQLRPCLSDFGLASIHYDTDNSADSYKSSSRAGGTLRWDAPELLDPEAAGLHHSRPSREADVWAMAMVMLEVFTGRMPYYDLKDRGPVMYAIMQGKIPQRPKVEQAAELTDNIWSIMTRCWVPWKERPRIDIVLAELKATHGGQYRSEQVVPEDGFQAMIVTFEFIKECSDTCLPLWAASSAVLHAVEKMKNTQDVQKCYPDAIKSLQVWQDAIESQAEFIHLSPEILDACKELIQAMEHAEFTWRSRNHNAGTGSYTADPMDVVQDQRRVNEAIRTLQTAADQPANRRAMEDLRLQTPGSQNLAEAPGYESQNLPVNLDTKRIVSNIQEADIDIHRIVISDREDALLQKLRHVPKSEFGYGRRERCMPDTRVDLLRDLFEWAKNPDAQPVFWLNGMAGTGKTTIAETFAGILADHKLLAASFFCSRDYADRNDVDRIFPSLVYRLARTIPSFLTPLLEAIKEDGNVADRDLVDQFNFLMGGPLKQALKRSSATAARIIIVDALDECLDPDAAQQFLNIILMHASTLSPMIKFFVTSRPEARIRNTFQYNTAGPHYVLRLHDIEDSIIEADIRLYMLQRLGTIPQLRAEYSNRWPPSEVDSLVKRAGKLFIYASTLCKFVEKFNSVERFRRICNLDDKTVLHTIDVIYQVVLENAFAELDEEEILHLQCLLKALVYLRNPLSIHDLESLLGMKPRSIRAILDILQSVLHIPSNDDDQKTIVTFYHASFPDYLTDSKRSGGHLWSVNPSSAQIYLLERCLDRCFSELHFNITQTHDSAVRYLSLGESDDSYREGRQDDGEYEDEDGEYDEVAPIAGHLAYACHYWADHLFAIEGHWQYFDLIESFIQQNVLYWLEVLVALEIMSVVLVPLRKLAKSPQASAFLSEISDETHRFIIAYKEPLSYGPAHIYLSALPWLPHNWILWQLFGRLFPGIPVVNLSGILPKKQDPVLRIEGHTDKVNSAAFSPDDQFIISGSDDTTVRVWDATTGEQMFAPFRGHTDWVNSVAVSPDGECVASGSDDGTIMIWYVESGKAVGEPLRGHTDSVTSVAFSSDGKRIVSGSYDNTIRTWSTVSGELSSASFRGHTNSVRSVTFSPDDKYIVSGSSDWTVGVWDASTGEALYQPLTGHTDEVSSVVCSPDGSCIASGSADGTIMIWSLATGQLLLGPLRGHTDYVRSVVFSPNGRQIISGSWDTTVRIWDSATGKQISTPFTGHTNDVYSVQFSSNSQYTVSASEDGTICVWEAIIDPAEISTEHTGMILSVAFSPNGKEIISGSADNTIRCWASESAEALSDPFLGHRSSVNSVAVSRDGQIVVSGSVDRTVRIWNAQQGQSLFEPLEGHTALVRCVAISDDGKFIVSGSADNTVRIWDALTGKASGEPLHGHTGGVYALSVSPDSELIASGSYDKTVRIWNAKFGEAYGKPFEGHAEWISSVLFSRDGKKIISGSGDKTIRLWDVMTGEALLTLESHTDWVRSIAISPDGEWIVSGSRDRTVRLWSTSTGEALSAPLIGHSDMVNSVAVSPDGRYVVSGSDDRTIRKWDVGTARKVFLEASDNAESGSACQNGDGGLQRHSDMPLTEWEDGSSGWIIGREGERLFWVPPELRRGLQLVDCNTAVIGVPYNVTLDLTRFVHGKDWAKCYEPE